MNHTEIESYIHNYGEDLYCFCRSLTRSQEEAEDLYQETFLKLYEMADRLEIRTNPKGCLMTISVNLYRNYKRKMAIRRRITGAAKPLTDLPSKEPDVSCLVLKAEEQKMLLLAIDGLADRYRLPVLLHYMEGLPLEDLAAILLQTCVHLRSTTQTQKIFR